jgi:hypothetical protein
MGGSFASSAVATANWLAIPLLSSPKKYPSLHAEPLQNGGIDRLAGKARLGHATRPPTNLTALLVHVARHVGRGG